NDPDYALSCYYALGQCYRARGDLRTATMHFDEAVDRVNLDALTVEESDQLVQLCQEAAEAHRQLGEQEQTLTVYNALLGFLRSRGWNDKVAQVEFMLKQMQNAPTPPPQQARPPISTPLPQSVPTMQQQPGMPGASAEQSGARFNPSRPAPMPGTVGASAEQSEARFNPSRPSPIHRPSPEQMPTMQQAPVMPPAQNQNIPDAATMAFNASTMAPPPPAGNMNNAMPPAPVSPVSPTAGGTLGELPDWLTGILNDADKAQIANKQSTPSAPPAPPAPVPPQAQPAVEQPFAPNAAALPVTDATTMRPESAAAEASTSWLTEGAKPAN